MSDRSSSKTAGLVLVGAAVLGVAAIALFSPSPGTVAPPGAAAARGTPAAAGKSRTSEPPDGESAGHFVAPVMPPERERIASPFSDPATDSAATAATS